MDSLSFYLISLERGLAGLFLRYLECMRLVISFAMRPDMASMLLSGHTEASFESEAQSETPRQICHPNARCF